MGNSLLMIWIILSGSVDESSTDYDWAKAWERGVEAGAFEFCNFSAKNFSTFTYWLIKVADFLGWLLSLKLMLNCLFYLHK